jgi:parvulin-like peptidyl-prolyl isomerase
MLEHGAAAPEMTTQVVAVRTGLVVKSISEMAPEDTIVAVNGVALTKKAFDTGVSFVVQRLATRPGTPPQAIPQIRRQMAKKFIPDFITRQLLVQEARRLKVQPSILAQERVDRDFAKMAVTLGLTVGELRLSPAPEAAFVRETFEAMPLVDALLKERVQPKIDIPDELVTNAIAAIDEENKRISIRNEERRGLLNKLREQILAGSEFASLADEHSECPRSTKGNGGYWGCFARTDIADRDVCDTIFNLKTNEVTVVLDDEIGFFIVKMLTRKPAIRNEKQEVVERESCELARILLLREPSLITMPPAMMKQELTRQTAERLTKEYVSQLMTQARIEYPHGTNFWSLTSGANTVPVRQSHPGRMRQGTLISPADSLPFKDAEGTLQQQ